MLAAATGLLVGLAAIAFREAIGLVQLLWLGTRSEDMLFEARALPWFALLLVPALGGLVVGVVLEFFMPNKRTSGVPDIIEVRHRTAREIPIRYGLLSSGLAAVSLGAGASAGREGPLVHLGGTIAHALDRSFGLSADLRRTLLGCGVAAAVSASFNAPIAGVLFAHEVVLDHFSRRAFVPIVIASALAAIVSRLWFGEDAAFSVPELGIVSYLEFPAFALLGVVSALVAIAFQVALFAGDVLARQSHAPIWILPAIGGLIVGAIGVVFPEVLGVGYSVTNAALNGTIALELLLVLIPLKAIATGITLGCRFGGGIFSPSLYLGAVTGAAFGTIAARFAPETVSDVGTYALLGMGAVAGAVLGAPISTAVIVFELTGGYALSIALLLSVAIAHGINLAIHDRSYFQWQLESRGVPVRVGPHRMIGRGIQVMDFMRLPDDDAAPAEPHDPERPALKPSDTLEAALRTFDDSGLTALPVVDEKDPTKVIAQASQVRALDRYTKALVANSVEEHR